MNIRKSIGFCSQRTSNCDPNSNIDEDEESQIMYFAQSKYLAILIFIDIGWCGFCRRLPYIGEAFYKV